MSQSEEIPSEAAASLEAEAPVTAEQEALETKPASALETESPMQFRIVTLEKRIGALKESAAELRDKLKASQATLQAQRSEIKFLRNDARRAAVLEQQIERLSRRLETAAELRDKQKASQATAQAQIGALKESAAELRDKLKASQATAQAQRSEIKFLRNDARRAAVLEQQIERLSRRLEIAAEESRQLVLARQAAKRVEVVEDRNAFLETEVKLLKARIDEDRYAAPLRIKDGGDRRGESIPIALVASGGSSGSHLLAMLLSRYQGFCSGPEPNLASRPDLFDHTSFRAALYKGLLRREPYFRPDNRSDGKPFHLSPPLVLTNQEDYLVESAQIQVDILLRLARWDQLVAHIHAGLVAADIICKGDCLIEHSPSAAASLEAALTAFPALRCVHLIRDPRDAIVSMALRRRHAPQFKSLSIEESLYLSAKQWCFLNARAQRAESCAEYACFRYEALVSAPTETLSAILAHFGATKVSLRSKGPCHFGQISRAPTWRSSPEDAVSTASIGRYRGSIDTAALQRLENYTFSFDGEPREHSVRAFLKHYDY